MHLQDGYVEFEPWDMPFVSRFGLEEAADMVLDFAAHHRHPFVFDTYQLAAALDLPRRELFALTRRIGRCYRRATLPKKSGGVRVLHEPEERLKMVQRRILRRFLAHFPVSPYAKAYRPGLSHRDNVSPHLGKRYLLKMDLMDFFDSITFEMIFSSVFHSGRFPRQIGAMLCTLCCFRDVLPQGAPTSPALSNLVMRHFDDRMGEWCRRRGIVYTRYCDDLTFSADVPLYGAYQKAKGLLEQQGFTLNENKTRFVSAGGCHRITGLNAGDRVTVPAAYRRQLRQEIYYVLQYGPESAILRGERQAFIRNGRPCAMSYCRHLIGRAEYVLHIQPELSSLARDLQALYGMTERVWYEVEDLPF